FVHLEQVAVALGDLVLAKALDGRPEVEIHSTPAGTDAAALVADFLGGTRRDVAGREVAERRILALEVVVALRLGDVIRGARVTGTQRHPTAAVVAERLRHQRELGLIVATLRDAGRVNLG